MVKSVGLSPCDASFCAANAMSGLHVVAMYRMLPIRLLVGNVSFGGSVFVEDDVSIGVGASIKPGIRLGEGSIIGVGAAVVKDVEPRTTVVGVPAKPI